MFNLIRILGNSGASFLFIFTGDYSSANKHDVTGFVDHTSVSWPWSLQRTHKFDLHCSRCKVELNTHWENRDSFFTRIWKSTVSL